MSTIDVFVPGGFGTLGDTPIEVFSPGGLGVAGSGLLVLVFTVNFELATTLDIDEDKTFNPEFEMLTTASHDLELGV